MLKRMILVVFMGVYIAGTPGICHNILGLSLPTYMITVLSGMAFTEGTFVLYLPISG